MSAEVLARAFEPFFTTKPLGQGSGLGLSIIHSFVEQSGGWIGIDSMLGSGTRVRLLLPRAEHRSQESAVPQPAGTAEPVGNGETVLLVEDEPSVRQLVGGLVSGLGYRLIEAHDGPSALRILSESSRDVDLLVTDVMLPHGINGFDLAQRARQLRSGLKVLFMSGYAEGAMADAGAELDEIELIRKPFRKGDLAVRLRQAFDRDAKPPRAQRAAPG